MVQVSNGSVLWSYRHEENMRAAEATGLVKFPVMARQTFRTSRPWWPWLIVAAGVVVAAAAEPTVGLVIVGVGVLAALVTGKKTSAEGGKVFEPVSAVLCRRAHIVDRPPPMQGPVGPVTSDTFREETRTSAKDHTEERRRELIKRSVSIFMTQLTGNKK